MKIIKSVRFPLFTAFALAGPFMVSATHAQTVKHDSTRFYVGGNYGSFKGRGGEFDNANTFKEAVVGFRFNPYLGLEGSFADWGDYSSGPGSVSVNGYGVAAQGSIPVSGTTSVYAKAGVFFSTVDLELVGLDDNYSERRPSYGVGVDFAVFDPMVVSVEYDRFKAPSDDDRRPISMSGVDGDVDTLKLGVKFMF